MTTKEVTLCTTCFDALGAARIIDIRPQSICYQCGKQCLGYRTEIEKVPEDYEEDYRNGERGCS